MTEMMSIEVRAETYVADELLATLDTVLDEKSERYELQVHEVVGGE